MSGTNPTPEPDDVPEGDGFRSRLAPPVRSSREFRALLRGKDELGILVTLFEGDPLRLVERTGDWMVRCCFLLDTRKLALKTLMLVADRAPSHNEECELHDWIEEITAVAAESIMREDARLAREGVQPTPEPMEPRFTFLMNKLGFEPAQIRRACFAFNDLPDPERHAVHNTLVQGKGFGRYAREVGIDAREARRLMTRAILAISKVAGEEDESDV